MANTDYSSNRIDTDTTNFDGRLSSSDSDIQKALETLDANLSDVTTVITTYTILNTDETIICNSSTDFTVTLPTTTIGKTFNIKNINTGVVTVEGNSSDTIDGELNQLVNQYETLTVQCYATNKWGIL